MNRLRVLLIGSPVSPIVANLYMEYLEQKALSTAPHPPRFWCRYVDDTFVIHKEANKQGFLQHINSVDPAIRFTVEDNKEDGSIPFLDTIVKPEVDGSLSIAVYRKPTHTDQYLQWDSNHHLSAKFSVIQTLSHRASIVCSNPELLQKEKDHLKKALTKCKYPKWALDKCGGKTQQVFQAGCWWGHQQCPSCQPWSEKQRAHSYTLHARSLWKYQKDLW